MSMDEAHLGAALRYVALNPVRARLTERAVDWPWPSVQVQLGQVADDGLTAREPVLSRYPNFAELIAAEEGEALSQRLRRAETIGRPLGGEAFIAGLERESGRSFRPGKRGPAAKAAGAE
ncbi:hypothetical protein [Phenylobacterium sp.]|uniref:hypothetical protein n=1 Tax=Phenylobacterium sp. TaxID=1871053 RepID=UPI0027361226|nr:hypothetical protein [Phenylobacterium sp.]MDP3852917.1 hypothetical protein [Phenylobacterium sp.]